MHACARYLLLLPLGLVSGASGCSHARTELQAMVIDPLRVLHRRQSCHPLRRSARPKIPGGESSTST